MHACSISTLHKDASVSLAKDTAVKRENFDTFLKISKKLRDERNAISHSWLIDINKLEKCARESIRTRKNVHQYRRYAQFSSII